MRYGTFRIPLHTLKNNIEAALRVLEGIVVIRAESLYHMDSVEYIGISKHFRDLEVGSIPPFYEYDYDAVLGEMIWIENE